MKLLINKIFILVASTILLASCSTEDLSVFNSDASTEVSLSATDVVLDKANEGQTALTVTWTEPDYGFNAAPNYKLVFTGGTGSPSEINVGSDLSKAFETTQLNKLLLGLGLKANTPTEVTVQVKVELSAYKSFVSNVASFNATAYLDKLDLITNWGVVGSGYNNWGGHGGDFPFYKTSNPDVLVTYVTLLTGEIKFRTNNSWAVNYGDDGNNGSLEANGANIPVTAGTYKITFNTADFTYSIEPYSWGIVGSGTPLGWPGAGVPADKQLKYDSYSDTWKVIIKLNDGEIKFRQNNDWGVNFGDNGADGTLDAGGANIAVTAGNYLVTVNFVTNEYEITSIPNIWGIVGHGTPQGWPGAGVPADQELTLDFSTDGVWILNRFVLLDGEVKFRANNDWALNYGDNGNDGSLEEGGANIATTAGRYDIRLDLSTPGAPTYTITPTVTY